MTARRGTAAAVLAGLVLCGCSGTDEKAEGAWGLARDGIQAMLYSPRATVKAGEPIEIHVRLRNVKGEINTFRLSADLTLTISRGDEAVGDDVDYVTLAPAAIELPPGHTHSALLRTYSTERGKAEFCKEPGLYRFAGKLNELELPALEIHVQP